MPPRTLRPWPISRHDLASGAATGFPLENSARSRSNAVDWRHNLDGRLNDLTFTPLSPAQQCVESYHVSPPFDVSTLRAAGAVLPRSIRRRSVFPPHTSLCSAP